MQPSDDQPEDSGMFDDASSNSEDDGGLPCDEPEAQAPRNPSERVLAACAEFDACAVAARICLEHWIQRRPPGPATAEWAKRTRVCIEMLRRALHRSPSMNLLAACREALHPEFRDATIESYRQYQGECLRVLEEAQELIKAAGF